jgi:hypothetical protein
MNAVPLARRTIFVGMRAAAEQLWGPEGLAQVGRRLPPEIRHETVSAPLIVSEWLPESYVLAWYDAVFAAHCSGQRDLFLRYIDRLVDQSFGRVRKLLLGIASPPVLAQKATELWRHDHTTGELQARTEGRNTLIVTLLDHPYTTTPRSCEASCEVYRYIGSLSRAQSVSGRHTVNEKGHLVCTYTWR